MNLEEFNSWLIKCIKNEIQFLEESIMEGSDKSQIDDSKGRITAYNSMLKMILDETRKIEEEE